MKRFHQVAGCCATAKTAAAVLALVLIAAPLAAGEDLLFPVVPPEEFAFNYPDPPREGKPDFFPIARDGQPQCVIVYPAQGGTVRNTAAALGTYLGLATGARFAVIEEGKAIPKEMAAIHVGDTAVARQVELQLPDVQYGDDVLPNLNGYLVRTVDPGTLVIRGRTEKAVEHGVVGFLKRYVGVHQYWLGRPGGVGDVIPDRPTLSIPDVEWRDWPYFFSRSMSMAPFGGGPVALDFFRRHQTLPCGENYNVWLPPAEYGESNPEYYPLIFGERLVPPPDARASGWQPCVSNPEVVRVMAGRVIDYFRNNPDAAGINFAINDGGRDCQCDACQALDSPVSGMGERYLKFTNDVAALVEREFPSKVLVYLAYAGAKSPPDKLRPHPMLAPVLTVPDSTFRAWDSWLKTGPSRMGLYIHHNDDFRFVLPKPDYRQVARRLHYAAASGRVRIFYMEAHPFWPLSAPLPYLTSEILWDPRQDIDELLDDYCRNFYGPAAKPMKAFHQTLEAGYQRWLETEGEPHPFGRDLRSSRYANSPEQFLILNADEAARAAAALAEAAESAAADPRAAERIQIIRWAFGLAEQAAVQFWTSLRLRDLPIASETDVRQAVADARKALELSRTMADYIAHTLEDGPAAPYRLFLRSPTAKHQNITYASLKSGRPAPEVTVAIAAALDRAADFLRESLGPDRAGAWWSEVRKTEKDAQLAAALEAAELRSRGIRIENLVKDPGFELLGAELAPDEFAVEREIVLDQSQERLAGIHQWFSDRSPYRIVISDEEMYSGRYSLQIEHCHRARVSRTAPGRPGERFRVGLHFKHDEGAGNYRFVVDAMGGESMVTLASMNIPRRPGEWQELHTDVVVPPDANRINLRVFINNQAPGARCWLDDLFIGRHPSPPAP